MARFPLLTAAWLPVVVVLTSASLVAGCGLAAQSSSPPSSTASTTTTSSSRPTDTLARQALATVAAGDAIFNDGAKIVPRASAKRVAYRRASRRVDRAAGRLVASAIRASRIARTFARASSTRSVRKPVQWQRTLQAYARLMRLQALQVRHLAHRMRASNPALHTACGGRAEGRRVSRLEQTYVRKVAALFGPHQARWKSAAARVRISDLKTLFRCETAIHTLLRKERKRVPALRKELRKLIAATRLFKPGPSPPMLRTSWKRLLRVARLERQLYANLARTKGRVTPRIRKQRIALAAASRRLNTAFLPLIKAL